MKRPAEPTCQLARQGLSLVVPAPVMPTPVERNRDDPGLHRKGDSVDRVEACPGPKVAKRRREPGVSTMFQPEAKLAERALVRPQRQGGVETQRTAPTDATAAAEIGIRPRRQRTPRAGRRSRLHRPIPERIEARRAKRPGRPLYAAENARPGKHHRLERRSDRPTHLGHHRSPSRRCSLTIYHLFFVICNTIVRMSASVPLKLARSTPRPVIRNNIPITHRDKASTVRGVGCGRGRGET